jgi:ribonuclease HI
MLREEMVEDGRERKRIKGRYEHFVWEKRDREKDKGKGTEDAEVVEVETMETAGGIEAGKFWDPYLDPPTPSLQTYLRALPSGQYYGIGRCLVATNGSLKLRRRERERETMGAGVAWQQDVAEHRGRDSHPEGEQREGGTGAHNVSRRVAGNLSSTRAELAAIAQAVKMAPIEKELVILIDSAAAIRRLTLYRRKDFRPHPRKTKDFDIVREIIESLDERGRNGARTTMVKVHGHTGKPLQVVADAMATEGANRKMEDEERQLYEIPETKNDDVFYLFLQEQKIGAKLHIYR